MNRRIVCRVIGMVLLIEALFMIIPTVISLCERTNKTTLSFVSSIAIAALIGLALLAIARKPEKDFYIAESFTATGLSWISISVVGALPFYFSGSIPSYIDSLFEVVSGFTTTGASILSDVEALPDALLYWRSFTNWLGGMGMLVFLLALLPAIAKNSGSAINLMRAESPGPSVGKLTPKLRNTAVTLYTIYISLTVICILFLWAGGMPLFESLCTGLSTAGTGGFAIKNDSMAGYSTYLQNVVAVFMLLFGVNFNIYYLVLIRRFRDVIRDEEFKLYILIVAVSTAMISINVMSMFDSFATAVQQSFFQVSSIITTTGFATTDFNLWPALSKCILLILMVLGGCAGSTSGGLKMIRALILLKSVKRNIQKSLNPRSTKVIQLNGNVLEEQTVINTNAYFIICFCIILFSYIIISFDNLSMETNISAVVTCFNNIGPGFDEVGATENFSVFGSVSKIVLIIDMLLGRLEIFPILAIFLRKR